MTLCPVKHVKSYNIYDFFSFTGKSAEKGGTMKQGSTTKDKDGDNSNNLSDIL